MFGYLEQKLLRADCEKVLFFLNLIFMSVRISFNVIHSVIKKMFHKGPVAANAVRNGIFYLWIFFNETWHMDP
jgi:hypothetical protein